MTSCRILFSPSAAHVTAEVVSLPADLRRGLAGRACLRDDEGMLFVMPHIGVHKMWMKGCLIPLDMIFLSSDCTVVGVAENAQLGDLRLLGPNVDSRGVLEVAGGWCARYAVRTGAVAKFI